MKWIKTKNKQFNLDHVTTISTNILPKQNLISIDISLDYPIDGNGAFVFRVYSETCSTYDVSEKTKRFEKIIDSIFDAIENSKGILINVDKIIENQLH